MSSNNFIEITDAKTDTNVLIKIDDIIQIKPRFDVPVYTEDAEAWTSNEIGTTIIMNNQTIKSSDEYVDLTNILKSYIVR